MQEPSFFDLRATVIANPWKAVAVAFAVGAWLALQQPRMPRSRLGRAAYAHLGAIAMGALRALASRPLTERARTWLEDQLAPHHT
jgi:hypothetical protein